MAWLEYGMVNVAELSPKQWKEVSKTAKSLMQHNMTESEYNMLKVISNIKNERDYTNASDSFDDGNDNDDIGYTELQAFYGTLDDVIDCALLERPYPLPFMG